MPAGTVPPGSAVTPLARCAGTGWWGPPPVRLVVAIATPTQLSWLASTQARYSGLTVPVT